MLLLSRTLMRGAMFSVFIVNKSGFAKQCVISSACCEPILLAADKQSDKKTLIQEVVSSKLCVSPPASAISARERCRLIGCFSVLFCSYCFFDIFSPANNNLEVESWSSDSQKLVKYKLHLNQIGWMLSHVKLALNANGAGLAATNVFCYL